MFSILAPTDFSNCSMNALNYATSFANSFDASLTILHASELQKSDSTSFKSKEESLQALDELQKKIHQQYPNIECSTQIEDGYAFAAIYNAANNGNYDLVIMGTHGTSRKEGYEGAPVAYESMFGSVTASLVGYSSIPIMAVHQNEKFVDPKEFILLTDFHRMPSDDSYKFLSMIASRYDSKVKVLYVENKPTYLSEAFQEMNKIEKIFEGINYEYVVVKSQDIEKTLLNMFVEDDQIITVISKEKSGLKELLGSSISQVLVRFLDATLFILPEYIAVYPSKE